MKLKRPTWIPVVTGVMKRDRKLLLGKRPEGSNLAGAWEFPGGKIEPGETPEEALKRELQEELGIDAEIGSLLFAASHSYGDTGIILLFYLIEYWKGEIKGVHHDEVQWYELDEISGLDLPDANRKVLKRIIESIP